MSIFTRTQLFEQKLAQIIEERISHLVEAISGGNISSIEEYKFFAGKIQGLRDALDSMEEAEKLVAEIVN